MCENKKVEEIYEKYRDTINEWELQLFYKEEEDEYDLVDGQNHHTYHDNIYEVEEEIKRMKNKEE